MPRIYGRDSPFPDSVTGCVGGVRSPIPPVMLLIAGDIFLDNYCLTYIITGHCRSGETGRRRGLKIPREQSHLGSIPSSGTSDIKGLRPV